MKSLTKQQRKKVAERVRNSLRELWSKSPYRSIALDNAKVKTKEGVRYKCAKCGELFYSGEVEVDHIIEMPRASYQDPTTLDWNKFVAALFVDPTPENVQVLCKKCHARKTAFYSFEVSAYDAVL